MKLGAYIRLMRFDKPVGIALLWLPTAWALWLVNKGAPTIQLLLYFFLGTICMRAAGCVINDIADRNIDKHVTRTRMRPLTTGELTVKEAVLLLSVLLLTALLIVVQLPIECLLYAGFALFITVLYPFCKRFFQAPQLILGIAFCMGIPMAYVASKSLMSATTVGVLMAINFAWIVSYDTMYAMVDRNDDRLVGVKSTAVLFADYDRLIISLLQTGFHALWLWVGFSVHAAFPFYICWFLGGCILIYQQLLVNTRQEKACFKAFTCNAYYGTMMWLGLILSL